jgi:hypothetical protein
MSLLRYQFSKKNSVLENRQAGNLRSTLVAHFSLDAESTWEQIHSVQHSGQNADNQSENRRFDRWRSQALQASEKQGVAGGLNIDEHWVRVSMKCAKLVEAKESAKAQLLEYKLRSKNQIHVVSKRFSARDAVKHLGKLPASPEGL